LFRKIFLEELWCHRNDAIPILHHAALRRVMTALITKVLGPEAFDACVIEGTNKYIAAVFNNIPTMRR
jgi:hypothetical protein